MNVNRVVTIVLVIAAGLAWLLFTILPGMNVYLINSNPDAQIPLATSLSAAACVGWVLCWLGARRGDGETRCRRCGHILRGLSEPRCPECGETI